MSVVDRSFVDLGNCTGAGPLEEWNIRAWKVAAIRRCRNLVVIDDHFAKHSTRTGILISSIPYIRDDGSM